MMIAVCQPHARRFCVAHHLTPVSRAVPHDGGETKVQRQGPAPRRGGIWAGLCHCPPVGLQTECSLSLCFGLCPSKGPQRLCWEGQAWRRQCSPISVSLAGSQDSPSMWPVQGAQEGAGRPPGLSAVSPSPAGPSTPLDLGLAPQPPGLGASWKAGPGAREGYLLRLSGPVDETLSLGPEALNVTFLGPLPSGHYALELRVLAGHYEARAQAAAWLGGESGLVGNGLGSCPGAPALRGVDPHPPGPTPLQML